LEQRYRSPRRELTEANEIAAGSEFAYAATTAQPAEDGDDEGVFEVLAAAKMSATYAMSCCASRQVAA
jgi:hypothetical protein